MEISSLLVKLRGFPSYILNPAGGTGQCMGWAARPFGGTKTLFVVC